MEGLSFTEFTRKILIRATREEVYACWATEAGICSWFLRKAKYTRAGGSLRESTEKTQAGDRYTWGWHNYAGEESGQILQAKSPEAITFDFAGSSRVTVTLEEKGGRVLVCLRQFGIPIDPESQLQIYNGCSNGWTFWLANLKAWLEHGILLHEKEADLRGDPLAGFQFVNI